MAYTLSKRSLHSYIFILLAFLVSNMISLYLGLSWHSSSCLHLITSSSSSPNSGSPSTSFDIHNLISHLNLTRLHATQFAVSQLRQELEIDLAESLFANKSMLTMSNTSLPSCAHYNVMQDGYATCLTNLHKAKTMSKELHEYIREKELSFGWIGGLARATMVSPIGHSCEAVVKHLLKYMNYEVGGSCPDDQGLGQSLMVHGCDSLPRRRCFARVPQSYKEPYPLPKSTWTMPNDHSIL